MGAVARLPADLLSVDLTPPPSPTPTPPPKPQPKHEKTAGAAAPPGKMAHATPVVAVKSVIPPPKPPPIVAATTPAQGTAARNGAALAGAGSGAGGTGNGTGSGGSGQGEGSGGTDLRQIAGEIRESDYPRDAARLHQSGRVHIRFTVGVNGRVSDCTVTRSSGSPSLDATTCRLIMQRFRYEPSRDAAGRPYPDVVEGVHDWVIGGGPGPDDEGPDEE
ncbi:MAG: energy transducer TonB [Novosphingobium sp.]|nr:energy transducer TonB [Novosphingobium sp.]